jgi:hypothetical protein
MSNLSPSGNATFDAAARAAENVRATAVAAANGVPSTVTAAEIVYYQTLLKSALANGVEAGDFSMALNSLGVRSQSMGERSTDPKEGRYRRDLRLPPKGNPAKTVQPGELLDLATDGQRALYRAGKLGVPVIVVNGRMLIPRRPYRPVHQQLSKELASARVACK